MNDEANNAGQASATSGDGVWGSMLAQLRDWTVILAAVGFLMGFDYHYQYLRYLGIPVSEVPADINQLFVYDYQVLDDTLIYVLFLTVILLLANLALYAFLKAQPARLTRARMCFSIVVLVAAIVASKAFADIAAGKEVDNDFTDADPPLSVISVTLTKDGKEMLTGLTDAIAKENLSFVLSGSNISLIAKSDDATYFLVRSRHTTVRLSKDDIASVITSALEPPGVAR